MADPAREVSISAPRIRLISEMQATRIIEARDHIAQAAYAAMRRVEAEAALCASCRAPGEPRSRFATLARAAPHDALSGAAPAAPSFR
jgi:hypothetical protein